MVAFLPDHEARVLHRLGDDARELHLAAGLHVDVVAAVDADLGDWEGGK